MTPRKSDKIDKLMSVVVDLLDNRPKSTKEQWDLMVRVSEVVEPKNKIGLFYGGPK